MCRNVSAIGHEMCTATFAGAAKRAIGGIATIQSSAHTYYAVHRCSGTWS